jgi:hypothetical protein
VSAALEARVAASPGSGASPSPTASGTPAHPAKLCVSVQRSQSSVARGQSAAYVVQVSAQNGGSGSAVTVALASQPASQKPVFTGGCVAGNGTARCPVGVVSDKQPVTLHVQIPVADGASSVTSVRLTATASVTTSAKWTPPSAAETVAVTAAAAAASGPAPGNTSAAAGTTAAGTTLPLGPVPNLNSVSSSLIGAGNASGLFPAINPGATPSPAPGNGTSDTRRNAEPVPGSSAIAFVKPGLTGQVAGLLALAVALLLTVTRLSLRRRFRSRKQNS